MKPANNNEVDLLLRALARERTGAAWRSGSDGGDAEGISSDHLDADELNSYAEGLAPAAARARYIEHLAECAACRGIVVGLTQAAGVATRLEDPAQTRGAGFWKRLSEFLSPKVLGYAIPALVLTAVIGIGFIALKQRQGSQFVAQNERRSETPPAAQHQTDSGLSSAAQPQPSVQNGTQSGRIAEVPKERTALEDEKLQAGQGSGKSDASVAKIAPSKDAGQADVGSVVESRPYAPEPKAAEAPPPAPVINPEKSAELAKERSEKREDQPRDQNEEFRVQTDDVHGPNRSRSNTAQAATQRGAGIMAGRGPSADKNKKGADVETRSVMGRHFTREGDAWVDTAYEYSQATVRVARGSDQFRALVADEPAIRTIAAQLNGVVIVVWKNRAYRIQ
ncbi:MAG TPA: zf-HC2 domain-containing protein [Pyrinomonadaceae bacterium]|nr:zf-HC2 domain-containing protein [Pyrinomonadaceae bacterium]